MAGGSTYFLFYLFCCSGVLFAGGAAWVLYAWGRREEARRRQRPAPPLDPGTPPD